MGPYERQQREQRRAAERGARRSELVGLGTSVSQTRVAPVINRSPYEGVRIGNSQQGSYQYGKDMREKGFVERMDINGNYRWVNRKTGLQPDGSPLNPARESLTKEEPAAEETSGQREPPVLRQAQSEPSGSEAQGPGSQTDAVSSKLSASPTQENTSPTQENTSPTGISDVPGATVPGTYEHGMKIQDLLGRVTSPVTEPVAPANSANPGSALASADVYRRQQDELRNAPIENFVGGDAEQIVRETTQQLAGMTQEQRSELLAPVSASVQAPVDLTQNQPPPDSQQGLAEDEKEDRAAVKGGEEDRFAMSRNFLARDEVPDSIFGYTIVSRKEDYTPEDLAFFRAHPEAGGYYDLGEGSPEDEPVQAAGAGNTRGRYPGSLNNPGNTGKHARKDRKDWTGEIDSPHDRWAKFDTPQNGLLAAAVAVRKIADGKLKPAGQPFTIRNYAYKYAPPEENDTEAYIKNISRYSGLDPDAELDRHDVDAMARLLRAKVRFESGVPHSEWFTDDEYRSAAEALQEGAYE